MLKSLFKSDFSFSKDSRYTWLHVTGFHFDQLLDFVCVLYISVHKLMYEATK